MHGVNRRVLWVRASSGSIRNIITKDPCIDTQRRGSNCILLILPDIGANMVRPSWIICPKQSTALYGGFVWCYT